MNRDMRTFLLYFYFSIFRMDLHNQGSHMRGHMTCHIDVTWSPWESSAQTK